MYVFCELFQIFKESTKIKVGDIEMNKQHNETQAAKPSSAADCYKAKAVLTSPRGGVGSMPLLAGNGRKE